MTYTVRTRYSWGWCVPQAPECPRFGSQTEAYRYAHLRQQGLAHLDAWRQVAQETIENHKSLQSSL